MRPCSRTCVLMPSPARTEKSRRSNFGGNRFTFDVAVTRSVRADRSVDSSDRGGVMAGGDGRVHRVQPPQRHGERADAGEFDRLALGVQQHPGVLVAAPGGRPASCAWSSVCSTVTRGLAPITRPCAAGRWCPRRPRTVGSTCRVTSSAATQSRPSSPAGTAAMEAREAPRSCPADHEVRTLGA